MSKLSDVRADAANRLRLAALSAPVHEHGIRLALDEPFARGFNSRGKLESWNREKMRRYDAGYEAKLEIRRAHHLRVVWGRTRYCLAYERGTIDRLAAAIEKMPARYFETPFEILEPRDS